MRRFAAAIVACALVSMTMPRATATDLPGMPLRLSLRRPILPLSRANKLTTSATAAREKRLEKQKTQTVSTSSAATAPRPVSPPATPASSMVRTPEQIRAMKDTILLLVNKERRRHSLPPLAANPLLEAAADQHARDMEQRHYFNHVTPEGTTPLDRLHSEGYAEPSCKCFWIFSYGENLAKGHTTPEDIVAHWLASAAHRRLILSPSYTDTGIGVSGDYWVEEFGGTEM